MEKDKLPKIKILVACHKADPNILQDDIYMPIQVGKALHPDLDLGFQCDNTGDNISEKNDSYCELTALYWAWKNLKDIDYIGLCHYRRYFDFSGSTNRNIVCRNLVGNHSYDEEHLRKAIDDNTIIVAKPYICPYNIATDYSIAHISDDLRALAHTVKTYSPEYYSSFKEVFIKNNKLSPFNMFICSWQCFDLYCGWLFDTLGRLEKTLDISTYSPVQKRIYGYMAERLFNVFIFHQSKKHKYKIKPMPVEWINPDVSDPPNTCKYHLNRLRYNLAFKIGKIYNPKW